MRSFSFFLFSGSVRHGNCLFYWAHSNNSVMSILTNLFGSTLHVFKFCLSTLQSIHSRHLTIRHFLASVSVQSDFLVSSCDGVRTQGLSGLCWVWSGSEWSDFGPVLSVVDHYLIVITVGPTSFPLEYPRCPFLSLRIVCVASSVLCPLCIVRGCVTAFDLHCQAIVLLMAACACWWLRALARLIRSLQ